MKSSLKNNMTNDEVIQLMRTSLKRDGKTYKVIGIISLLIPLLFVILIMADIISGTFSIISKKDIDSDIGLFVFVICITLPGIFVFRNGVKKSKPENNKVYNIYIQSPEKIKSVYEEVVNNNCDIIIRADDKSELRIDSNIQQYRYLKKFIESHCINAAEKNKSSFT